MTLLEVNPLIPTATDVAFSVLALAFVALAIWAVIDLYVQRNNRTHTLLWLLLILLAPFIGSLASLFQTQRMRFHGK
ncbi:PLDc N-terminal domain-containing protein [Corynebacterium sp.]|uniref:PLDc N-terminal domain-containing protein n=1 Tax=Corynebacterium sp. TaxID=1720 RepID=UPI0028B11A1B|nr:PLDc N-terminal domain-containing protein [Corynebacterium sp.]